MLPGGGGGVGVVDDCSGARTVRAGGDPLSRSAASLTLPDITYFFLSLLAGLFKIVSNTNV